MACFSLLPKCLGLRPPKRAIMREKEVRERMEGGEREWNYHYTASTWKESLGNI